MSQMAVTLPDYAVHHPASGGHETTIFLLHGAFGAKEYWRTQVQAFTQAEHPCAMVDGQRHRQG